jgi:hypothetical protein
VASLDGAFEFMSDSKLLRLDPLDNVLVAIQTLEAGDTVIIEGRTLSVPCRLTLGHKLAARDIRSGEKILKYHMPIGSATRDIAAGEHVHLHNMKSDYIDTVEMLARHSLAGQRIAGGSP